MKPLKERIEIETHFLNGGQVRSKCLLGDCSPWETLRPGCRENFIFSWAYYDYEKAPRTFTIAGKEYPAALTNITEKDAELWIADCNGKVLNVRGSEDPWLINCLVAGSVFSSREDAEASVEALAKLRRGEL